MAAPKKTTYINTELEWCEKKLLEWKEYVDANPLNTMTDRMAFKQTAKGMISMVSATIESQIKSIRDTMKEYLLLLETVDRLRKVEESKTVETRGNTEMSSLATDFLNRRK